MYRMWIGQRITSKGLGAIPVYDAKPTRTATAILENEKNPRTRLRVTSWSLKQPLKAPSKVIVGHLLIHLSCRGN